MVNSDKQERSRIVQKVIVPNAKAARYDRNSIPSLHISKLKQHATGDIY